MSTAAPPRPPRVRRSPEAARELILSAAEALLLERGPQALKLTDVAVAAGVSQGTVLHHFGSIEDVHTALMERMIAQLVAQILQTDQDSGGAGGDPEAAAQILFDVFESRGAARLAAWLELTGEYRRLTSVRGAMRQVIARRVAQADIDPEALEDLIAANVALAMGVGLFGRPLAELMGRPAGSTRRAALEMVRTQIAKVRGQAG